MRTLALIICLSALRAWAQPFTMADPAWMAQQARPASAGTYGPLTNGIVAYWPLDEYSGTRNSVIGAEPLSDVNANVSYAIGQVVRDAAFVHSSTTVLRAADDAVLGMASNPSFTIKAWVKAASLPAFGIVVDKGAFTGNGDDYLLYYVGGSSAFSFIVGNGSSYGNVLSIGGAPALYVWHLLVAAYNSTNQTVMISLDNVTNIAAWTGGTQRTANALAIGNAPASTSYGWDGEIDEVCLVKGVAWDTNQIYYVYTNELFGFSAPSWGQPGVRRNVVLFDGDSITSGAFNGGTPRIDQLCSTNIWFTNLWNPVYVNEAVAGDKTFNITNRLSNVVGYTGPRTNVWDFVMGGINDIANGAWQSSGYTMPVFVSAWTNYYAAAKLAGVKVVANTVIPQSGLTNDVVRLQFNTNVLLATFNTTNLDNSVWMPSYVSGDYADATHLNLAGDLLWAGWINETMTNAVPNP